MGIGPYKLEDQIGFIIRKAIQKHTAIFTKYMNEQLTPTQWAALVKVSELKSVSQNQLGRDTAMDVATIKGVVDRLLKRGLVTTKSDPGDSRKNLIEMTEAGKHTIKTNLPAANTITNETLSKLTYGERQILIELLRKLG